jgi:hypothetical protein
MMDAKSRATWEGTMQRFAHDDEAKYPKAVKALCADVPRLLTHVDFPAAHWKPIRTTNPIESTFATVKLRTRGTKGAGSRVAGLTMAFKLLQAAQRTWRRLDAQDLLPLVRAGIVFKDGLQVEHGEQRPERKAGKVPAYSGLNPQLLTISRHAGHLQPLRGRLDDCPGGVGGAGPAAHQRHL